MFSIKEISVFIPFFNINTKFDLDEHILIRSLAVWKYACKKQYRQWDEEETSGYSKKKKLKKTPKNTHTNKPPLSKCVRFSSYFSC